MKLPPARDLALRPGGWLWSGHRSLVRPWPADGASPPPMALEKGNDVSDGVQVAICPQEGDGAMCAMRGELAGVGAFGLRGRLPSAPLRQPINERIDR